VELKGNADEMGQEVPFLSVNGTDPCPSQRRAGGIGITEEEQ